MSLAALWGGAALALAVQEPRVTFEHRAARVELLFPELSKAAGTSLTFSAQTKDEVLIVSVRDVPLSELRAKIAEAASAEWQAEEGGFRLIRSAKLLQKLEEEHVAYVAESVKAAQERVAKSLESAGGYSDAVAAAMAERIKSYIEEQDSSGPARGLDFARVEALRSGLPGWRLACRLAVTLDPKAIAAIPPGQSVVFSSMPNRRQIPFPHNSAAALQTYAAEAKTLARALPAEPKMPSGGLESNLWNAINLVKRTDFVPAKVLLRVRAPQYGGGSYLQMIVADANGKAIERAYLNLTPRNLYVPPPPAKPDAAPKEEPLAVSPLTQELIDLMGKVYRPDPIPNISVSPALQDVLWNPERFELSGLLLSDLILGLAKVRKLNVVVSPIIRTSSIVSGAKITPTALLNRLSGPYFAKQDVTLEKGWLLAKPSDWVDNRDSTPDRRALGRFIREATKRPLGVDDFAALALSCPTELAFSTAQSSFQLAVPQRSDSMGVSGFGLLQLHGSLTPPQRRILADGKVILFGALTPWQQNKLSTIVYGQNDLMMEFDYSKAPPQPGAEYYEFHNSLQSETTEAYPNGIPPDAQLTIKDESSTRIRCFDTQDGNIRSFSELTPESLAHDSFRRERPDIYRGSEPTSYNQFAVIEKAELRYMLRTQPLLFHHGQISFTSAATASVKSIDALPEAVRKQVADALERIREQYKNVKPPGW